MKHTYKHASFFLKIFSGFLTLIAVLTILVLTVTIKIIQDRQIDALSNSIYKEGVILSREVNQLVLDKRFSELDQYIKSISRNINTRFTVIAPNGVVLADSEKDPALMDNHGTRREIREAMEGSVSESMRFSKTLQEEMLYVAQPMYQAENLVAVMRTSLFVEDIKSLLSALRSRLIQTTALVSGLALILAFFLSRTFSAPIEKLIHAAKKVSQGDFSTRVVVKHKDEISHLATAFNDMISNNQALFNQIKQEKDELNCILSSINEIIIVMDYNGKIILVNNDFNGIIDKHVTGLYYNDVFTSSNIRSLVSTVIKNHNHISEEIQWKQRDFLTSVSYVSSKMEIILVLHNITEIKKLERIKRDFVSNVSHELRTPLTAIKGFVETLEDEEKDTERRRYFQIIQRHTDRLINIVQDLLMLSKLEQSDNILEKEPVDLSDLLNDLKNIYETKVLEKNLTFNLNIDPAVPRISADRFKLEQLLINLIDNAIKYTDQGKVEIRITSENRFVLIEVEDTGIGIPEKHLSRIFERFYVIDKSRSRKLGGTGLGLSIVKHIVLLHNGQISLESRKNEGTKFSISLPV